MDQKEKVSEFDEIRFTTFLEVRILPSSDSSEFRFFRVQILLSSDFFHLFVPLRFFQNTNEEEWWPKFSNWKEENSQMMMDWNSVKREKSMWMRERKRRIIVWETEHQASVKSSFFLVHRERMDSEINSSFKHASSSEETHVFPFSFLSLSPSPSLSPLPPSRRPYPDYYTSGTLSMTAPNRKSVSLTLWFWKCFGKVLEHKCWKSEIQKL